MITTTVEVEVILKITIKEAEGITEEVSAAAPADAVTKTKVWKIIIHFIYVKISNLLMAQHIQIL